MTSFIFFQDRGVRSVMVIGMENEIGDTSSNPTRGCLHFLNTNTLGKRMLLTILAPATNK